MSASLRQTGLLATRLAASQPAASRAFSTTFVLRNKPSASTPRVNPLIGNSNVAPTPEPKPTTPAPSPSRAPAKEAPTASQSAASTILPPPPPPAAEFEAKATPSPAAPTAQSSPMYPMDITSLLADRATASLASLPSNPLERPMFRCAATVGRTIFVKDRGSPTSAPTATVAMRMIDRVAREQKIRTKNRTQKFHERPGLRRKRLKSERWRARFKTGFKAACSRVLELKKQGW
ncbi:hypothetical protein VHEMI02290 [[Torrubiella] hemipterigena]|uniref:Ribosomal protein S21 n=1 Tax=[Torrubiella] hemipterigena TaxID=1531966 RepID=A0A0A1T7G4_9HYPO|nr:hypothetical protein VHEMI02290 [[Torrubiella] hemipterigena]